MGLLNAALDHIPDWLLKGGNKRPGCNREMGFTGFLEKSVKMEARTAR
jgi:hypothetical protein